MSYYNELKKYKTLTHEEEIKLFQQYNNGDINAKNKLIECNLKLVMFISKGLFSYNFDDLIQIGNEALIECIEQYDVSKGYRFNSYAYPTIRFKMMNYINKNKIIFDEIDDNNIIDDYNPFTNNNDVKELIIKLLDSLDEKDKIIMTKYYYDNQSFREIGDGLNTSKQLVHHHYKRIMKELKNKLKNRKLDEYL